MPKNIHNKMCQWFVKKMRSWVVFALLLCLVLASGSYSVFSGIQEASGNDAEQDPQQLHLLNTLETGVALGVNSITYVEESEEYVLVFSRNNVDFGEELVLYSSKDLRNWAGPVLLDSVENPNDLRMGSICILGEGRLGISYVTNYGDISTIWFLMVTATFEVIMKERVVDDGYYNISPYIYCTENSNVRLYYRSNTPPYVDDTLVVERDWYTNSWSNPQEVYVSPGKVGAFKVIPNLDSEGGFYGFLEYKNNTWQCYYLSSKDGLNWSEPTHIPVSNDSVQFVHGGRLDESNITIVAQITNGSFYNYEMFSLSNNGLLQSEGTHLLGVKDPYGSFSTLYLNGRLIVVVSSGPTKICHIYSNQTPQDTQEEQYLNPWTALASILTLGSCAVVLGMWYVHRRNKYRPNYSLLSMQRINQTQVLYLLLGRIGLVIENYETQIMDNQDLTSARKLGPDEIQRFAEEVSYEKELLRFLKGLHVAILLEVGEFPNTLGMQGRFKRKYDLKASTVSANFNRLVKEGYIEQLPLKPNIDLRKRSYKLTKKGYKFLVYLHDRIIDARHSSVT